MSLERLVERQYDLLDRQLKAIAQAEPGPKFLGLPDRWYETPTFRCPNDHVSIMVLRSELHGDQCLAAKCRLPTRLTFPEDREGPFQIPDVYDTWLI